jgi:hypothetical protein
MKQISPSWDILLKSMEDAVAPATFLPVHTEIVEAMTEAVARLGREEIDVKDTVAARRQETQRILDERWAGKGR